MGARSFSQGVSPSEILIGFHLGAIHLLEPSCSVKRTSAHEENCRRGWRLRGSVFTLYELVLSKANQFSFSWFNFGKGTSANSTLHRGVFFCFCFFPQRQTYKTKQNTKQQQQKIHLIIKRTLVVFKQEALGKSKRWS